MCRTFPMAVQMFPTVLVGRFAPAGRAVPTVPSLVLSNAMVIASAVASSADLALMCGRTATRLAPAAAARMGPVFSWLAIAWWCCLRTMAQAWSAVPGMLAGRTGKAAEAWPALAAASWYLAMMSMRAMDNIVVQWDPKSKEVNLAIIDFNIAVFADLELTISRSDSTPGWSAPEISAEKAYDPLLAD